MKRAAPRLQAVGPTGGPPTRGFVMIVGMIFLTVVLMLGIALFRSSGLQERIAGNTREKARALEAAQSALQYGEWWLQQSDRGTGAACNSVKTAAQLEACSNALAAPATLPWSARFDYRPPAMTVAAGGGLAGNGDINYQAQPGLYVQYLGLTLDAQSLLYQVTAFGYGGSASTAAVVQSTFQVGSQIKDLGADQ